MGVFKGLKVCGRVLSKASLGCYRWRLVCSHILAMCRNRLTGHS